MGLLLNATGTFKPCHCRSKLPVASISTSLSLSSGGSGGGFGGWEGGGGGGGGDGFSVPSAGASSIGTPDSKTSESLTEDVIVLDVGVSFSLSFAVMSFLLEDEKKVMSHWLERLISGL